MLTHAHVTCHELPGNSFIMQLGSQRLNVMLSTGMCIEKGKTNKQKNLFYEDKSDIIFTNRNQLMTKYANLCFEAHRVWVNKCMILLN